MNKKLEKIFHSMLLLLSFFILTGCSTEAEFDSFYLQAVGIVGEGLESPSLYLVSPREAPGQLSISHYEVSADGSLDLIRNEYSLEETSVTEEEIRIVYENQTVIFERISSSVAVNEVGDWYNYVPYE